MKFRNLAKKVRCFTVAVSFVFGGAVPSLFLKGATDAKAAWDGYVQKDDVPDSFSVLNLNSIKSIISAGAKPSKEYTTDGNMYSARWYNQVANDDFKISSFDPEVPTDWSAYSEISFKIYYTTNTLCA